MNKALKSLRQQSITIILIELIIVAAAIIIFFYNLFDLKQYFTSTTILISAVAIVIFNVFFTATSFIRISRIRQKSDLKAAELLGADVQEAYNFGMLGLVVVDENQIVLWTNTLFKERQINLLDLNIVDWNPKLRELQNTSEDKVVKIEVNSRNYNVKYLNDAGLYIFKDDTEYESVYKYSKDQAIVLGVIMIDNLSDVSGNLDDSNDVITKVKNIIYDYAKENGILLRRYRNDAYFAVCSHVSLEKMREDGFSILDRVHAAGAKEDVPPTLSIGFAYDFPDITKLNDMATNAIDIAMSRGGDQVVVSKYGDELAFYGGKTEAQESRNKVKIRVMADALLTLIKNSPNALIMGHTEMDMDALGACLGVKAICDYLNKPCNIVFDSKLTEKKTRIAFVNSFSRDELSRMTILPKDALDKLRANTLVIVVDVHRPSMTMAPKLLEKATKIIVIDHHRRAEDFIESPIFSYIDPSASSSSELVIELIRYSGANPRIELSSTYATIMLSGIFLDTNSFKAKSCGTKTFEASMFLKEYGADNSIADDFLKDEFEEYQLITKIISTMKTPYLGVVYCLADEKDIIDRATLAKVANKCMQLKGVNACFVIGNTDEKETRISARSDGTINVQILTEKMGGGGHFAGAATLFKNSSIEKCEQILLETLDEYLSSARMAKK